VHLGAVGGDREREHRSGVENGSVLVHGFRNLGGNLVDRLAPYLSRSPAVLAVVGRGCRPLYKARSLEDKGCAGQLPSVGCRSATLRILPGTGECVERLKEEVEKRKMPLSGEAIRMMNYVDDVATTMRRLACRSSYVDQRGAEAGERIPAGQLTKRSGSTGLLWIKSRAPRHHVLRGRYGTAIQWPAYSSMR